MTTYPTYKPSGLPWIRDVPAHWGMTPNKYLFRIEKETVGLESANFTLLSLSLNGVVPRDLDNPKGKFPAEFDTYQVVEAGDLIFCLFDIDETPRTVGLATQRGMTTGAYTVARCLQGTSAEYLYYYYLVMDTAKCLKPLYTGLRKTIQKGTFLSTKTPLPPPAEQAAIVAFLDRKGAEIDRFLLAKRRLITFLREQKAALITQAVTHGLNPHAPTKPSGVAWLGDVPAHWDVRRLKFVARLSPSKTETDHDAAAQVVFLPMENISTDGRIDCSIRKPVAEVRQGFTFFGRGDIVIAKITPCFENGKGAWLHNLDTATGYGTTELIVLRPKSTILPQFLYSVTINSTFRTQGTAAMTGSAGQQRVPTDFVRDYPIALPPLDEQVAIVAHIDREGAKIDKAIARTEREMELIHEYRATLISEAVTGKWDVRQASQNAPHAAPILTT